MLAGARSGAAGSASLDMARSYAEKSEQNKNDKSSGVAGSVTQRRKGPLLGLWRWRFRRAEAGLMPGSLYSDLFNLQVLTISFKETKAHGRGGRSGWQTLKALLKIDSKGTSEGR